MAYYFTTPTISEGPLGEGQLFERFRLTKGVSVMRVGSVWYEDRFFSSEDVAAADRFYLGGIKYQVSAQEKAELEAAGYTVTTE